MSQTVLCPHCGEYVRASSIFVERPRVTHCPFCGAPLDNSRAATDALTDVRDDAVHPLVAPVVRQRTAASLTRRADLPPGTARHIA
jgi:endogenous inhibitor of DNA gyrase (YacG/DUF329 family)